MEEKGRGQVMRVISVGQAGLELLTAPWSQPERPRGWFVTVADPLIPAQAQLAPRRDRAVQQTERPAASDPGGSLSLMRTANKHNMAVQKQLIYH